MQGGGHQAIKIMKIPARQHGFSFKQTGVARQLVQGFLLWPGMIPDAIEGVLIDLGILDPSGPDSSRA